MSNRKTWNVRLRHVWLATPLPGKRFKRRQRVRVGLQDALDRKKENSSETDAAATEASQS